MSCANANTLCLETSFFTSPTFSVFYPSNLFLANEQTIISLYKGEFSDAVKARPCLNSAPEDVMLIQEWSFANTPESVIERILTIDTSDPNVAAVINESEASAPYFLQLSNVAKTQCYVGPQGNEVTSVALGFRISPATVNESSGSQSPSGSIPQSPEPAPLPPRTVPKVEESTISISPLVIGLIIGGILAFLLVMLAAIIIRRQKSSGNHMDNDCKFVDLEDKSSVVMSPTLRRKEPESPINPFQNSHFEESSAEAVSWDPVVPVATTVDSLRPQYHTPSIDSYQPSYHSNPFVDPVVDSDASEDYQDAIKVANTFRKELAEPSVDWDRKSEGDDGLNRSDSDGSKLSDTLTKGVGRL